MAIEANICPRNAISSAATKEKIDVNSPSGLQIHTSVDDGSGAIRELHHAHIVLLVIMVRTKCPFCG
jgi:hypothetical protein